MKAGRPCPRCGGQVMAQYENSPEGGTEREWACVQCGGRPDQTQPAPSDVAEVRRE